MIRHGQSRGTPHRSALAVRLSLLASLAASLLACGDASGPKSRFPDVAGTYDVAGTFDVPGARFEGTLELAQPDPASNALTGRVRVTVFLSVTTFAVEEPLADGGTNATGGVLFTVRPTGSASAWHFTGRVDQAGTLSGAHSLSDPSGGARTIRGSWRADRR